VPDDPQVTSTSTGEQVPITKTEEGKYVLRVDGKEEVLTEQELLRHAQLGRGAYRKFEEAANLRKEADGSLSGLREALLKADTGDPGAYAKVLEFMGLEEGVRGSKVKAYQQMWEASRGGSQEEEEEEEPVRPGRTVSEKKAKLGLEDLPPEIQRLASLMSDDKVMGLLNRLNEETREKDRNKVYDETWEDVASDDVLGRLVAKGGPRAEKLKDLSKVLIRGRIRDGETYNPTTRQAVVKELRRLAEEFGGGAGTPTPIPGLGFGPGLSHVETQATKKPDRIPMGQSGWEDNLVRRLAHETWKNQ
jgi:hypothetical protein